MLKIGSLWKHYKTKSIYKVLALSVNENTLEATVTYQDTVTMIVFTTPLKRFLSKLPGKATAYRFTFIDLK